MALAVQRKEELKVDTQLQSRTDALTSKETPRTNTSQTSEKSFFSRLRRSISSLPSRTLNSSDEEDCTDIEVYRLNTAPKVFIELPLPRDVVRYDDARDSIRINSSTAEGIFAAMQRAKDAQSDEVAIATMQCISQYCESSTLSSALSDAVLVMMTEMWSSVSRRVNIAACLYSLLHSAFPGSISQATSLIQSLLSDDDISVVKIGLLCVCCVCRNDIHTDTMATLLPVVISVGSRGNVSLTTVLSQTICALVDSKYYDVVSCDTYSMLQELCQICDDLESKVWLAKAVFSLAHFDSLQCPVEFSLLIFDNFLVRGMDDEMLVIWGCRALGMLCYANDDIRSAVCTSNNVKNIIRCYDQWAYDANCAAGMCWVIANLSRFSANNQQVLTDEGVCDRLVACVKTHGESQAVITEACIAIKNLTTNTGALNRFVAANTMLLLLHLIASNTSCAVYTWTAVASLAAHPDCRCMYIENGMEGLMSKALITTENNILLYRAVVQCLSVMIHEGTVEQVRDSFASAELYAGCANVLGAIYANDIYTSSLLCSLIEKLSGAGHIGQIVSSPISDILIKACIRWATASQESALLCGLNAFISLSKDMAIVQMLLSGGMCKVLPKFLTAYANNSLLLLSALRLTANICESNVKSASDKLISAGLLEAITSLYQLHQAEAILNDASILIICTIFVNIISTKQFFKQLRRSNCAICLVDMLDSANNDVAFASCRVLALMGENSDCRSDIGKLFGVKNMLRLLAYDDDSPLNALSSLLVSNETNCSQLVDAGGVSILTKKFCTFTETNLNSLLIVLLSCVQYCVKHSESHDKLLSISETAFVDSLISAISSLGSEDCDAPLIGVLLSLVALLTSSNCPHSDIIVVKLIECGFVDRLVAWERSISCDITAIAPLMQILISFCHFDYQQHVGNAGAVEATCALLQSLATSPAASALCIDLLTSLSTGNTVMAMRVIALGGIDILVPLQARYPDVDMLSYSISSCVRSLFLGNSLADPPLHAITLLVAIIDKHTRNENVVAMACSALGVIASAFQANIVLDKLLRSLMRSLQRFSTSVPISVALCITISHVARSAPEEKVLQDTTTWELLSNVLAANMDDVVFVRRMMEALSLITNCLATSCVRTLVGSPFAQNRPKNNGVSTVKKLCEGVVAVLQKYDNDTDLIRDSLNCIYHLSELPDCRSKLVVAGACPMLVDYIKSSTDIDILSAALRAVSGLTKDGQNLEAFSACAGAEAIAAVCTSQVTDECCIVDICRAIVSFTLTGETAIANCVTFGAMNVCEFLLSAVQEHINNEHVFCYSVLCVGTLTLSMVGNATRFAAGGILQTMASGRIYHNESENALFAIAFCWRNLATQGVFANQTALLHKPMLSLLSSHANDSDIVFYCSAGLTALSEHGVESCQTLFDDGVSKVLSSALRQYFEGNLIVTVEVLKALASLCHNHVEISNEVIALELPMLIVNIMKLYATHEALLFPACQVIQFAPSKNCAEAIVSMMRDNVRSDSVLDLGCRTIASLCSEEEISTLLLEAGVCDALYRSMSRASGDSFAFLQRNNGNAQLAETVCLATYCVATNQHHCSLLINAGICDGTLKLLSKFSENEGVFVAACKIICTLCDHCTEAQQRFAANALGKLIINAIEYHGINPTVAMWGCRTLQGLVYNNEIYISKLGSAGACRCVANAVMRHQNSRRVISSGLSALGVYASVASNCYNLGDAGACELAVTGLQEYGTDELVALGGCRAIGNLSRNPGNCAWLGASGACPCILRILEKHPSSVNVSLEAWNAVSIMCATNAGCRGRFGQLDACLKAVEAIRYFSSNGDGLALSGICPAIENLALDKGNLTKLLTHGVIDALFEALRDTAIGAVEQVLFSVISALCSATEMAQNAVLACNGLAIVFNVLSRGEEVVGGCKALTAICLNHHHNKIASREVGGCSVLVDLLLNERLSFAALISVCQAVTSICEHNVENQRQCGVDGMIVPLFRLASGGDSALTTAALRCISSLSIAENIPLFLEAGASPILLALLQSWGPNSSSEASDVIVSVLRVVCIINGDGFKRDNVIAVIIRAIQTHDKSSDVTICWLQLVNLLARNDTEMQTLLCNCILPKLLVKLVMKFAMDESVAVEACRVTTSLTHEHPEAQAKCHEVGFGDMLDRLKIKHVASERVLGYLGAAELSLGTPVSTSGTRLGSLFRQFSGNS